jgi:hypothetical protein
MRPSLVLHPTSAAPSHARSVPAAVRDHPSPATPTRWARVAIAPTGPGWPPEAGTGRHGADRGPDPRHHHRHLTGHTCPVGARWPSPARREITVQDQGAACRASRRLNRKYRRSLLCSGDGYHWRARGRRQARTNGRLAGRERQFTCATALLPPGPHRPVRDLGRSR